MNTYPGDEIIAEPNYLADYRIEIKAPAAEIWPWLVQVGYHRGGWYIDTWWDKFEQQYFWPRVVPEEARGTFKPPAEEILPEFQNLAVGDTVPDGPPNSAYYIVQILEPNRALVLKATTHFQYTKLPFSKDELTGAFTWAFLLKEIDAQTTELHLRNRTIYQPAKMQAIINPLYHLVDRAHQKAMLKGIKRRVEGKQSL